MLTLEQALQISQQVKYDWNKPETVNTINPHLETITKLATAEFLEPVNLKDHVNLIQLFSQAAAFYLHNSPQNPDAAFKYLECIKDIFPNIVFSDTKIKDLSGEIQNLLSFYYQQKGFRANNAGQIQQALDYLQTSDQICEKLFAEYEDVDSKVAFAYCIQALNSGERQVINEKLNKAPNHNEPCALYERAFRIYDDILPSQTLDNQYARAKARYAQFLLKAGRAQEAINVFNEVEIYWRQFDYKSNPYAHRTFLAFAKSLVELSSANSKPDVAIELNKALLLTEEALSIQEGFKFNAQQLGEAKTIYSSVIRLMLSKFQRSDLDDKFKFDSYQKLIEKGSVLSSTLTDSMEKLQLAKQLGIACSYTAKFSEAIKYFDAGLKLYQTLGLEDVSFEEQLSQQRLSEQECNAPKVKNVGIKSDIYQTRGTTYIRMGLHKEAVASLKLALRHRAHLQDIFSANGYNAYFLTVISCASASIYAMDQFTFNEKLAVIPELKTAMEWFQSKLTEMGKPKDSFLPFQIAEGYVMLASLYIEGYATKQSNISLQMIKGELALAERLYEKYLPNHLDRIRLYNKQGYFEYLQGNYDRAEQYFLNAEKLAIDLAIPTHHIFETDFGLKVTYECMGKHDLSLKYHNKFVDDRVKLLGEAANSDHELAAYLLKLYGVEATSNENVATTQSHLTIALQQ